MEPTASAPVSASFPPPFWHCACGAQPQGHGLGMLLAHLSALPSRSRATDSLAQSDSAEPSTRGHQNVSPAFMDFPPPPVGSALSNRQASPLHWVGLGFRCWHGGCCWGWSMPLQQLSIVHPLNWDATSSPLLLTVNQPCSAVAVNNKYLCTAECFRSLVLAASASPKSMGIFHLSSLGDVFGP